MAFNPDKCLKFTAVEDSTSVQFISFELDAPTIYFSKNGEAGPWLENYITLDAGESAYAKCDRAPVSASGTKANWIESSKPVHISGQITSLLNNGEGGDVALPKRCFYYFFSDLDILSISPDLLPSTTLGELCYSYLFSGCSSFETMDKPLVLPATTLPKNCYQGMFAESNISKLQVNFTEWPNNNATLGWMSNISVSDGVFYCPDELPRTYGISAIPTGWTATAPIPLDPTYLTITALENNCVISLPVSKVDGSHYQFSKDGINWVNDTITINKNEHCYVKGTNVPSKNYDTAGTSQFSISQPVELSGHVTSLFDGDGSAEEIPDGIYHFSNLFANQPVTKIAPNFLNAKILKDRCYFQMFGWTQITETTAHLFPDGISGTGVNWAEHLYIRCHQCKTVVKDTFPKGTYCDKFFSAGLYDSNNLEKIEMGFFPEDAVLGSQVFNGAFAICPKLNHIEFDRWTWSDTNAYTNWVQQVASEGTFYCYAGLPELFDNSHIPVGWKVEYIFNPKMRFIATEDDCVISIPVSKVDGSHYQFSKDGETWVNDTITLNKDELAFVRGTAVPSYGDTEGQKSKFTITKKVRLHGHLSCMVDNGVGANIPIPNGNYGFDSLLYGVSFADIGPELFNFTTQNQNSYRLVFALCNIDKIWTPIIPEGTEISGKQAFRQLFSGATIKTVPPLFPKGTVISGVEACRWMFLICYDLEKIEDGFFDDLVLGYTTFQDAFKDCTSLKQICAIKPQFLGPGAFQGAFVNCSALTETPAIETDMADGVGYVFYQAFSGCTNLKKANKETFSSFKTFPPRCFGEMFSGCSSLNYIAFPYDTWHPEVNNFSTNWVQGVASEGIFVCPLELSQIFDASHIPFGWTVNPKVGIFYKPSTVFKKEEV